MKQRLIGTKVLFLDFDGVLHPNLCPPNDFFMHAAALGSALIGSDVEVVISSSWRLHHGYNDLLAFIPQNLRTLIVGATGPAVVGRYARWNEIQEYRKTFSVWDWRALDDAAFEFPAPCPELIRCNGSTGLQEAEIRAVVSWAQPRA